MNRHYFTKNGISDFIINDNIVYINFSSGKQLTHMANSWSEIYDIEKNLIEMLTSKVFNIIGYFDYKENRFGFIKKG